MAIVGERKRKRARKPTATIADMPYSDERWEIERDLDALCRAEAVKKDPERMKKCQKMAACKIEESKRKKEEAQAMIDMGLAAE